MESKLKLHLEESDKKPSFTEEKPQDFEVEPKTKHKKIEEKLSANEDRIKTKCRFCALDLHTKSGGMACEHFFSCDFTTKNFEEYKV